MHRSGQLRRLYGHWADQRRGIQCECDGVQCRWFQRRCVVRRWGRYATANVALLCAALVQLAGATLDLRVMVLCGFFLGLAGQTVKLCADSAMQIDVDDALRGHVFAVQDALFWMAFIVAITAAAAVMPPDGHSVALALAGSAIYLGGLAVHARLGRRHPARPL